MQAAARGAGVVVDARMTTAEAAAAFVAESKAALRLNPARVHDICNAYLRALRSGSRRRSYARLRAQMRDLRAKAAKRLSPQPSVTASGCLRCVP